MAGEGKSAVREGLPFPLGATWDGKGTNFALFSANASKVEICLFDGAGEREVARVELPEYTNQIFHGYLPEVAPGTSAASVRASARSDSRVAIMALNMEPES